MTRCNGFAWGLECPRRLACANTVPREEWGAQRFPYSMPPLEAARRGWTLLACAVHNDDFEHFVPRASAGQAAHGGEQMGLLW